MNTPQLTLRLLFEKARRRSICSLFLAFSFPSTILLLLRLHRDARQLAFVRPENAQRLIAELVTYCRQYVPYYCDLLPVAEVDFRDIPVLTKHHLQSNFSQLIARSVDNGTVSGSRIALRHTTGSSGIPTNHLRCECREDWFDLVQLQLLWKHFNLPNTGEIFDFGLRWYRQPIIEIRKGPGVFISWNFRGLRKTDPMFVSEYTAIAQAGRPKILFGHPSRLVEFAQFATDNKLSLSPVIVISTYEQLSNESRAFLFATFKCPIVAVYGTVEVGMVGWECSAGFLHWNPSLHVVEVLDEADHQCVPGQVGRLVVTPLRALTMPLLRYDTGDLAMAATTHSCKCGLDSPFIGSLEGRHTALLVTTDLRQLPAYRILRFAEILGLPDLQLAQEKLGEIRIIYPTHATLSASSLKRFRLSLVEYIGEQILVVPYPSDEFIRTPSGKKNPFVSLLNGTVKS